MKKRHFPWVVIVGGILMWVIMTIHEAFDLRFVWTPDITPGEFVSAILRVDYFAYLCAMLSFLLSFIYLLDYYMHGSIPKPGEQAKEMDERTRELIRHFAVYTLLLAVLLLVLVGGR